MFNFLSKKKIVVKTTVIEKKASNNIYAMKLHDSISLGSGLRVVRVAGGWVYITTVGQARFERPANERISTMFVPYSPEFLTVVPEFGTAEEKKSSLQRMKGSDAIGPGAGYQPVDNGQGDGTPPGAP